MRYVVQHRYRSSQYGPWDADSEVELDPGEAAWVNHDSPGCLIVKDAEPERTAEPAADDEVGSVPEASRPNSKAPKPEWVDWAVESGRATRNEAEQMTVKDLQAL